MTIIEMLQQSAVLTFLGMAVVFLFLWIMIICINAAGKLLHKYQTPKITNETLKPEITAAISAAVTEYREKE